MITYQFHVSTNLPMIGKETGWIIVQMFAIFFVSMDNKRNSSKLKGCNSFLKSLVKIDVNSRKNIISSLAY